MLSEIQWLIVHTWLVALIAACLGPGMADYAVAKCHIFTQFSN